MISIHDSVRLIVEYCRYKYIEPLISRVLFGEMAVDRWRLYRV